MVRALLATLAATLALGGCAEGKTVPPTALVLVSDTDIASIDTIRFEISQTGKQNRQVSAQVGKEPLVLTLVHDAGSLGPLEVRAVGLSSGTPVLTRPARVSFVAKQTLTVELFLSAACVGGSAPRCGQGETCTERGCQPIARDSLAAWSGEPPELVPTSDAGSSSAGDGGADGGDGGPCSLDLMSDVNNCGGCGQACLAEHATPFCEMGTCRYECREPWENCNQDTNPFDGCETNTNRPEACGCGDACPP